MRTNPKSQIAMEAGMLLKFRLDNTDLIARYGLNQIQTEGMYGIAESLMKGESHVYVELAGGEGKTRMQWALIDGLSAIGGAPIKTLVKAPTNTAGKRFIEEAEKLKCRLYNNQWFGRYNSHNKQPEKDIVLTTNMSHLRGHALGVFKPSEIKLIISDEGHRQLADGQIAVNEEYPNAIHISMTATPEYSAEKTLSNHFHCAYSRTLDESIQHGRTTDYDNYMLMIDDVDISSVKKQAGDFNQKELISRIDNKSTYRQTAEMIESWVDPNTGEPLLGRPMVVYVSTTQMAENAKAFFNKYFKQRLKGNPDFKHLKSFAFTNHSANMDTENEKGDENFRAGKHLMMIGVRSQAESYSFDKMSVCINITSTMSKVLARQRGLRVMRQDDDNPDKRALIIDLMFRDTSKRALLFAEAAGNVTFYNPNDVPDILAGSFKNYWQLHAVPNPSEGGPRLITPNEMVTKFGMRRVRKHDDIFMEEVILPGSILKQKQRRVRNDLITPAVRKRMSENNYLSIREIFNEAAQEREPDAPKIDYHKMLLCVSDAGNSVRRSKEFLESCRHEREVLADKLGMKFASVQREQTESDREVVRLYLGDVMDYEKKFDINMVLPKVREQMEKMGIETFTDLYSLAQMEYPFRVLHENLFFNVIRGVIPVVRNISQGSKKHRSLMHDTLAMSRLFGVDPRELFSEDQYFDLLKTYQEKYPERDMVLTESFSGAPRTREDDEWVGRGNNYCGLMVAEKKKVDGRGNNYCSLMVAEKKKVDGTISPGFGWQGRNSSCDVVVTEAQTPPRWMNLAKPISDEPIVKRVKIPFKIDPDLHAKIANMSPH